MRAPLRLVVTASTALLLSAGCTPLPDAPSGPPTSSTVDSVTTSTVDNTTSAPPSGNAAAWCALAPASLIQSALGLTVTGPTASFSTDEIHCDYQPASDGSLTVALQFRLQQDHDSFVSYRQKTENPSEPVTELPGVGDEAYYVRSEFGVTITHTIVARQGSIVLLLSAPSSLAQTTDLARQIVAKLT